MKLVNATELDNNLQNIANKIREKTGTTELLSFPNDFNTQINNSYTMEDFASKNFLSNIIYLPTTTSLHAYAFSNSSITEIHAPNIINLEDSSLYLSADYIFKNCQNLTVVDFPNLVSIRGDSIFHSCENLNSISFPELSNASETFNKIFQNASGLKTVFLPKCPALNYMFKDLNNLETVCLKGTATSLYTYPIQTFANCPNLIGVDIFDNIQSLRESFLNDTKLKTVILRYSSKIISLSPSIFKTFFISYIIS